MGIHSPPLAGQSRRGIGSVALVAAAHFTNDAITSMLPALLPLLAARFALSTAVLTMLVGLFAVSTSMPQAFFGALADRVGAYRVGAVGLALTGLLVGALGHVGSAAGLFAVLLLGGLGSAAMHPAGIGLARHAASGNAALAVAVFASAGMVGGASGPVVAIAVAGAGGVHLLAWAALPAVVLAAAFFRFSPRPGAPAPAAPRRDTGPRVLARAPIIRLALVAVLANIAVLTFTNAVPVWLVRERGVAPDSPVIGWTLAAFSSAAAAGGILGGVLTRWIRREALVIGSLALAAVALQVVLVAGPGTPAFFAATMLAGALVYLHTPLIVVRAQELSPGSESAVAGLLLGMTAAVAGVVYGALGPAQSAFGLTPTMAAAFLGALPASRIAWSVLAPAPAAPAPTARLGCACLACACEGGCMWPHTPRARVRRDEAMMVPCACTG